MKFSIFLGVSLFIFSITSFSLSANKNVELKKETIESLLEGISSDNRGLKTSSAFMLGEFELNEGVIPLMRILKSDPDEDARIMAALSLMKIRDGRGVFAVKQAERFDESERVRKLCRKFFNNHLSEIE